MMDRVEVFLYDPTVKIYTPAFNIRTHTIPKEFLNAYKDYLEEEEEYMQEKYQTLKILKKIKDSLKNDDCVNRLWNC